MPTTVEETQKVGVRVEIKDRVGGYDMEAMTLLDAVRVS